MPEEFEHYLKLGFQSLSSSVIYYPFAENKNFIFHSANMLGRSRVLNLAKHFLKSEAFATASASELLEHVRVSPEAMSAFEAGIKTYISNIRGTSPYGYDKTNKADSYVRHRCPTFFMTVSCCEQHWKEIVDILVVDIYEYTTYLNLNSNTPDTVSFQSQSSSEFENLLDDEYLESDDYKKLIYQDTIILYHLKVHYPVYIKTSNINLANKNPHLVVSLFLAKFKILLENILMKEFGVNDYFWKAEFQSRGSIHIHMMVNINHGVDTIKDGEIATIGHETFLETENDVLTREKVVSIVEGFKACIRIIYFVDSKSSSMNPDRNYREFTVHLHFVRIVKP